MHETGKMHLAPVEGELLVLARMLEVGAMARGKMGLFMDGKGVEEAVGLLEKGVGEWYSDAPMDEHQFLTLTIHR